MLYTVFFEDDDRHAGARQENMAAHLAFLSRNAHSIRAAGPLTDASDETPAGGLWLVEAAGLAAVNELIRQDPFWPTGLRKSVRVLRWDQVFAADLQKTR